MIKQSKNNKFVCFYKRNLRKYFFSLIFSVVFSYSTFGYVAHAATIIFDPQETTVGPITPFKVGIMLDSFNQVNTISVLINVPDQFEVTDISDGNSIINFWVEKPHINNSHQLVFSGIIPGGFSGIHAKLLTLTLKASRTGQFVIGLDPNSRIYLNSLSNLEESITALDLNLNVVEGRDNLINSIPDIDLPNSFTPLLVQLPDISGNNLLWHVAFQSHDKGSGINHYEVAESSKKIDVSNTSAIDSLNWYRAVNPYLLRDQKLTSFVYVRAIDDEYNKRVEFIEPQNKLVWYERGNGYIILVLIVVGYIVVRKKFVHTKK